MSLVHRFSRCIFIAGGFLALHAACANADVLHSPLGYTVTIPHGWQTQHEVKSYKDGGRTDMMFTHPNGAFPLFRVEVDPQRQATMQNAEAMQALFIQKQVGNFRVLAQRQRRVAGSPSSETAAIGPFQGQTVIMDMIYTIHAGRIYTITLMTTPRTQRPDLKTFERILGTLQWS